VSEAEQRVTEHTKYMDISYTMKQTLQILTIDIQTMLHLKTYSAVSYSTVTMAAYRDS